MRPHSFVLSWGRKMFFGLGWPFFGLIGLNYLQSQIVPSSSLGGLYFFVTLIGHYGMLTALLYFALYAPLARLFPYYYFCRLWSLILIFLTSLLIFVDSVFFSLYRLHFNRFILRLIVDEGIREVFRVKPSFTIVIGTIFLAALIYMWYLGDKVWRKMQRRFSNSNGSWYLVLIFFCVVVSQCLHVYGDAFGNRKITRHARSFSLYFPLTAKSLLDDIGILPEKAIVNEDVVSDFGYPVEKMVCSEIERKNILFITVNNWRLSGFKEESTPLLMHYVDHGLVFQQHLSPSVDPGLAIFSLYYALPGPYSSTARKEKASPVFIDELKKRNYELSFLFEFSPSRETLLDTVLLNVTDYGVTRNINEEWRKWLESHLSSDENRPFFGHLGMASPEGVDEKISEIIESLHAKGLASSTLIVITGTNAGSVPLDLAVPLLIIWPGKSLERFGHQTSHYDVIPTIMKEEWMCQNPFDQFSEGGSLFDNTAANSFILGEEGHYLIIDYEKQHVVSVDPHWGHDVKDFSLQPVQRNRARRDLVLSLLRKESRFRKQASLRL